MARLFYVAFLLGFLLGWTLRGWLTAQANARLEVPGKRQKKTRKHGTDHCRKKDIRGPRAG